MGCFNVACGISNLSISSGTPTVLIPLVAQPRFEEHKMIEDGLLPVYNPSLIYSHCYFKPIPIPIRGKYNDYGSLEDVEHNHGAAILENYFGMSVSDLNMAITRYGYDSEPPLSAKVEKLFPRMSGMFVLAEVYDSMSKTVWVEYEGSYLNNRRDRFKDALMKRREYIQKWDEERYIDLRVMKTKDEGSLTAEMLKELTDLTMARMELSMGDLDAWTREYFDFNGMFKKHMPDEVIQLLTEWQTFYANMYSCNRFFFPSMNGEQHGNIEASLRLVELSKEILHRDILKSFEWNGEESIFYDKYKHLKEDW